MNSSTFNSNAFNIDFIQKYYGITIDDNLRKQINITNYQDLIFDNKFIYPFIVELLEDLQLKNNYINYTFIKSRLRQKGRQNILNEFKK